VTPPGRRTTHTPWVSSAGRPSAVRDAWPAARNSASLLPCSRAGISTRAMPGAVDLADRRLISVRRSAFLCLHPHRALARPIGFGSRLGHAQQRDAGVAPVKLDIGGPLNQNELLVRSSRQTGRARPDMYR